MSTALLIRVEALEQRVAELEATQGVYRQPSGDVMAYSGTPGRVAMPPQAEVVETGSMLVYPPGDILGEGKPLARIRKGARGKWYAFKEGVRISGGFDEQSEALNFVLEQYRGQTEAERLENA